MEGNGVPEMGDIPAAQEKFNMVRLGKQIQLINAQMANNEVNCQLYSEMYLEWTKMFGHMGKALGVAFSGKYFILMCADRAIFNVL